MADDTRHPLSPNGQKEDLSKEALTLHPENRPFSGSQWSSSQAQSYKTPVPPQSANLMEGGTTHTAGGKVPEVTLWNALHAGRPITEVHRQPCVRDSFMVGIGSGFAVGSGRAIFGASIWKSCNWAVGSAAVGAIAMYQYCQFQRQAEKAGMTRMVEVMHKKSLERQARDQRKEKLREERRELKDKEQDAKLTELKAKTDGRPWWKVW